MEERTSCCSRTTLFQQERVGGITYRIPALLYIPPARALLAFAEKRSTVQDSDALYLVLRRGQRVGHSVQWGPQVSLMEATLPGFRTMNPCPVWERKSGRVFLFFICVRDHITEQRQICSGKNAARLCFVSSEDHGRSWSQIKDLTEAVIDEEGEHWATFAVGPGHGVQLQSGRLVIPAYAYQSSRCSCLMPFLFRARPHSLMFYSDDLGATWKHGQLIQSGPTVECEVAEVMNWNGCSVLYCSARTPGRCRAEAFSTDLGEHFEKSYLVRELLEPPHGCQGSVVSFRPRRGLQEDEAPSGGSGLSSQPASLVSSTPEPEQNSRKPLSSWLIYSHPTSNRRRVNLGLYLNQAPLEAARWSQPWIFNRGPSGYSDLAALEGGLFGCLFECGEKHDYEQIVFQMFTDQELLSHTQDTCSERASHSGVD